MERRCYSKRHYARVSRRPDTSGEIAERIRHRAACEQAVRERAAHFPTLTAENVAEAIGWQTSRIAELVRQ